MKLYVSKNLGFDEDKLRLASEFTLFCAEHLPIENNFEVHLVSNREQNDISTTAVYAIGKNVCKIYGKNRAFVDILRSVAHEMTHMMQDEMGLLVGDIRDAGGFHEDQANSKAGELIKLFAKSKEDRKAIYESRSILKEEMVKPEYASHSTLDLESDSFEGNKDLKDDPLISKNIGKGVNLSIIDPEITKIIKSVFDIYKKDYQTKEEYKDLPPVVTSVFRGPETQARVMFNNWKMHGGKEDGKGTKYLIGLYVDDKMAQQVGDVFTKTGKYDGAVPILKKQKMSSHGLGKAVDFRSRDRPYMDDLINKKLKQMYPKLKIIDERYKKGTKNLAPNQHWHLGVP